VSELPKGWAETNIETIAEYVQRGKSPKYTEKSDFPVVNQKCVRWSGVDTNYLKFIHPDQWNSWTSERFLRDGDILWNSTGTGTIGRAAIFKRIEEYDRLVVDSHVTIVRSSRACNSRFLHFFIQSHLVQSKIEDMQSGSTNQVELSRKQVLETAIPLPPLNEQKRIADRLDLLLTRIDKAKIHLDRIPPLLKRFRQSVLAIATSGKLTEDWREERSLGIWQKFKLFELTQKITDGEHLTPKRSSSGKFLLSARNIQNSSIALENVDYVDELEFERIRKRCDPSIGDVLLSCSGSVGSLHSAGCQNS
jgi:type I restriction enzyme, S subunit